MKPLITILFVCTICFSLTGCRSDEEIQAEKSLIEEVVKRQNQEYWKTQEACNERGGKLKKSKIFLTIKCIIPEN